MRQIFLLIIFVPFSLFATIKEVNSDNELQPLNPLLDYLINIAHQHKQDSSKPVPLFAIGGCPGVGKTTLTKNLLKALQDKGINCKDLPLDDFNLPLEERKLMGTNWNVDHFKASELQECLSLIYSGEKILTKPTYDQVKSEVGSEIFNLCDCDIVLFDGLYALCSENPFFFFKYCVAGVFLEADECDIYRWRSEREQKKIQPRSQDQFVKHLDALLREYHQNIEYSKKNALFVIQKDHLHNYKLEIQRQVFE